MDADRGREPLDAQRIFATLAEHGVEFVLIGGLAAQTHGNTRMTNDVDLIPGPSPENLARLADAPVSPQARILKPEQEGEEIDAAILPRAAIWALETRHGDVDVLREAPGAAPPSSCGSGRW